MTVAAILLAAGESTRMGRLKQLLPWDGSTLLEWQVNQLFEGGASEVVVVLGHEAAQIRTAAGELKGRLVVNDAYREGRASSLRAGAKAIREPTEAVVILSVDQPRPAWVTRKLLEAWKREAALVVIPRLGGHSGHPVIVAGSLLAELRTVDEATLGLRAVLKRHLADTEAVDFPAAPFDVDLNTAAEYRRALASFGRGEWNEVA